MLVKVYRSALLLNVSSLTLRRWTLAGEVKSEKVSRMHLFKCIFGTNLSLIPLKCAPKAQK